MSEDLQRDAPIPAVFLSLINFAHPRARAIEAGAERLHIGLIGPGFELLGTASVVGLTFEDADFMQAPRAVVMGHRFWQQRFGAD